MLKSRTALVSFAVLIGGLTLSAQEATLSGPISGYVFDSASRSVRAIMGLPGAAYLGDPLPDVGRPYKVLARKCSLGLECNLAGFACRWSYTNPDYDPFAAYRISSVSISLQGG